MALFLLIMLEFQGTITTFLFIYLLSSFGLFQTNNLNNLRTEMLSRFAKVLPGGAFEKPKNQQLSYGGMTATRANIGFFDCFFF